jgi:Protein of unknown function (DUF3040)
VALSMEEQRILAEMERNLAAEDPRLASRLTAFGQRRPTSLRAQRVRTIAGLLALAMIAAVTITMFMLSPYVGGRGTGYGTPRAHSTTTASTQPTATTRSAQSAGSSSQAKSTKKASTSTSRTTPGTTATKAPAGHSGAAKTHTTKPASTKAATGSH